MNRKIRLLQGMLFPCMLFLLLPLFLAACGRWTIDIVPPGTPVPTATSTSPLPIAESSPGSLLVSKDLTFTAAVPEFGTPETGRQDISLGRIKQPGRYILQLANNNPPFSGHWLEWDYLALEAGGHFVWRIGQDETPPDYNYTGQATDEFCNTAVRTDCKTVFEAVAGKIDERGFPKTLNDGEFPAVMIAFTVSPEQTDADLVLTLSTLYSSHVPDTKDFKMKVSLYGPY